MNRLLRPLRVRLAIAGFAAIYVPVLIIFTAALTLAEDVDITENGTVRTEVRGAPGQLDQVLPLVLLALAPVAAGLAWWWSGRAVRPIGDAVAEQERLIEEASHELRTPLSILSANADVLLAHPDPTLEVYRHGLERSGVVARRMAETVESMLVDARGRARTIDRRPVDLGALARSAADGVRPLTVSHQLAVQVDTPRTVRARVDAVSVERAITNLLTNAIKAAPAGSVVDVAVGAVDGHAEVTVTDHGAGIEPAEQAKIFERYWQGDEDDQHGAGIGLAIVRQVAVAHGGAVTVTSPLDDGTPGTRFTLRLAG